jgi:4-hydroxy-tetrahydrodipicolinate reductase
MGRTVCATVEAESDLELVGRADPELNVPLEKVLDENRPEVVVDFTTPDAGFPNARLCLERDTHAVVGTTGISESKLAQLADLAGGSSANCFVAPNFAIGAVLMMEAAKLVAPHMPDCEIVELHHEQKLDAPSGTAKRTAEMMRAAHPGDVPIHSVRLPGVVADQDVILGDVAQTLTLRHVTTDRTSFMPGVLLAVRRVGSLTQRFTVGLESLLE